MHKFIATVKAVLDGGVSIYHVDKTAISRAPGDVTNLAHN